MSVEVALDPGHRGFEGGPRLSGEVFQRAAASGNLTATRSCAAALAKRGRQLRATIALLQARGIRRPRVVASDFDRRALQAVEELELHGELRTAPF